MKVIVAFLLAKLRGNENPTTANSSDDLKKIFGSVGAQIDETKIDMLFSLIKDHDVMELIAGGREKMVDLSPGGPTVAMVAGGGAAAASATEPVAETKLKVEEVKEESSDGEGMLSLFD